MIRNDRLGLLQVLRVVIAGTAIAAVALVDSLATGRTEAVPALLAWVLVTLAFETTRRVARITNVAAPLAMLVIDGFVLAFVISDTGGYRSPLVGLVYLHVVAVSLLVSHRVGLRIALWHGLLLFGGFVAGSASAFGLRLDEPVATAGARAALHATGFLLVAVGVAACAALNESVVRRTHRELSAVADVGGALAGELDVDTVLRVAAETLRTSLEVPRVAIAAGDADGWRGARATAEVAAEVRGRASLPPLDETSQVRGLGVGPLDELLPAATNVVVAPFSIGDGRGVVLVEVGGGPKAQVPLSMVTTITHIATLVGTTIENARLHARIEDLASRDGLTGLANRRVFDDAIADDVRRARRTDEPFSLVVLDVDHFKKVNDDHGHQVGDDVLQRVAGALAKAARESDLVARFGGEEFVVLLRGCGVKHAMEVADDLRRAAIRRDGPAPVTVSAGVASFPEHATDEDGLIAAADAALYQAKRDGRDRTCQARPRRGHLSLVVSQPA